MPVKKEVSQNLTGKWKIGLFETPCKAPPQFCYGCCCICCAVYQQRNTLLDITGEPYVCCAGLCPCGPLGQPQESRACLIAEVCCCTGMALSGNRFMVQTRFDKENTPCDDCIIIGTCLFVYAIEIIRCFCADIPAELDLCVDCLVMVVNGCMYAQQQVEIEEIKRTGYQGPPAHVLQALPPTQQTMVMQGKMGGGGGGFAPAGGYGGPSADVYGAGPSMQQAHQARSQPQSQARPQQVHSNSNVVIAQAMPVQQVQVACGGCGQIFGSPQMGVQVACPYCQTINSVGGAPPQQGMAYGHGGGHGFGGGPSYGPGGHQQSRGRGPGMGAGMAAGVGVGAGVIGGMMMADMIM